MRSSGLLAKYLNLKLRLFLHGVVTRRCHSVSYDASSRLALQKNPSILLVPLFSKQTTSVERIIKSFPPSCSKERRLLKT
jgi:hypothetical protein